jgi:trans-2,3-dihydro-3-hydroxyanthranilate isomerase
MKRRYVTADVFTDRVFGGNPLAVVLDAVGLSSAQMQSIAQEFNYSETTFVLPPADPTHSARVRIFTPRCEVPFAGHPNVGTAFLLSREVQFAAVAERGEFIFEETAGLVPVRLLRERDTTIGAELLAPEPLSRRAIVTAETAAACLSLDPREILTTTHLPQVVSVGLPFLVAEVTSRDALTRAKPDLRAHERYLPLDGADAIYAYWCEPGSTDPHSAQTLHARVFAPLDGVVEDPATGSANAALVALLATLNPTERAERLWHIRQGVDMGRPSLLIGRTEMRAGVVTATRIGGHCAPVFSGSFLLDGAAS